MELNLEAIMQARESIRGKALVTPVVPMAGAQTLGGNPVWLKAENLQPAGSFKIRGATNALTQLTPVQRAAGVVAYSTGNHAQAVALAAQQLGIAATIVMSPDAPAFKVAGTRRYGATVVMAEPTSQARREVAEDLARTEGRFLVPPYDNLAVMAGQGTIGVELLEQCDPAAVFVPIGGGGLIGGIAAAIKQSRPGVPVIGVEPEWENDAYQSLRAGRRVELPGASASIADAIRVQTLGDLTYPLLTRYVDEVVTVTEAQIAAATLQAFHGGHLVVEPAGALGLAAAQAYAGGLAAGKPAVAIASGGNTTVEFLWQLHGAH